MTAFYSLTLKKSDGEYVVPTTKIEGNEPCPVCGRSDYWILAQKHDGFYFDSDPDIRVVYYDDLPEPLVDNDDLCTYVMPADVGKVLLVITGHGESVLFVVGCKKCLYCFDTVGKTEDVQMVMEIANAIHFPDKLTRESSYRGKWVKK